MKNSKALPPLRPIIWRYQFQQFGSTFLFSLVLLVFVSVFYYLRIGYFDLYIANKAMASSAALILGIVLLLGPLQRAFVRLGYYLQYRKELGIWAFFIVLAHGISSFFLLPDKFPLERFLGTLNWPFLFALMATLILLGLFVISFQHVLRHINPVTWWKFQKWGLRTAIFFSGLHFLMMKLKE